MTNDNEQPEAPNEQPSDAIEGPEPAAATPEQAETPVAAVEEAPQAAAAVETPAAPPARSRWRPSRGVVTIAAAAVAGVLLFGSGFAVGHAVDGNDGQRPMLMRDGGMRESQRPMPMDRQMPRSQQMPDMPGHR